MFSNLMLTADSSSYTYLFGQLGVMIVMIAVLWFFLIRPQNKREKEVSKMREALEVGDEVITRGDYVMIETGSDRTKMRIARWAIDINTTAEKEK